MMGAITKASYEALAAECAEWYKRAMAAEAALRGAERAMTCRLDTDDAHYCPNCDQSSFNARAHIRNVLAGLTSEGEP